MKPADIKNDLIYYTINHSNFDTKRDYISISHIHLPAENLIDIYKHGFKSTDETKLKCYKGYQMERDLIFRLKKIYGDRIKTNIEYQKGIVKGHPDFELDGIPGDCKSVLMDEWLPDKKLPMKVYWQIQGYLYLSQKRNAILIYESRESGMLKVFEIFKNDNFQNQIKTKLDKIYEYFEHKPG